MNLFVYGTLMVPQGNARCLWLSQRQPSRQCWRATGAAGSGARSIPASSRRKASRSRHALSWVDGSPPVATG